VSARSRPAQAVEVHLSNGENDLLKIASGWLLSVRNDQPLPGSYDPGFVSIVIHRAVDQKVGGIGVTA